MNRLVFNPFTGNFDYIDDEVHEVTAPSTVTNEDIEKVSGGTIYFWVSGHRYKLAATLDDPVISATNVGANAALSLLGP